MINDFTWHFQTKVVLGAGAQMQAGAECKRFGDKAMLVYYESGGFLKESGLLDQVKQSLEQAGVTYVELSGIKPNPEIDKVREGVKLFRESGSAVILAIGGGSVIDTAKAIAAGAHYEGDPWDLFVGKAQVVTPPPVGVVLTIAATGSEGSNGAVITNPETKQKFDVLDSSLRPAFALLNPEITLTLPPFHTACGVVDIFSHAMERYFTNTKGVELTDRLGEAVMKTALNNGYLLHKDPKNLNARSQVMWAGTLAHNGILEGGRASCWASHMIGTEISAHYDTVHGATLSVIIPAWMKYIYKDDVERFARFANAVMEVEYNPFNLEETALKGIEKLESFFRTLQMPTRMAEIGVESDELFETMATSATRFGTVGCIKKLDRDDVVAIYRLAQ